MKFRGKTVWITGASSGVGEGLASVFHREGANLIISARREAELDRVRTECNAGPGSVHVAPFDIADAAQRDAAARDVLGRHNRLDVLINNAGISQRSLAQETQLDVDRRVMEVDYFGPVALTKLVLPRMIEQQGGHLVVTSSVAGKHGVPYRTAYCAAKHALHGFFDTLRIELLEYRIDVTLLVIAGVQSNVAEHALTGDGSEFGHDDWQPGSGMTAEECAGKVVDALLNREQEAIISIEQALQAMRLKAEDPVAFTERMARMMKWMAQKN